MVEGHKSKSTFGEGITWPLPIYYSVFLHRLYYHTVDSNSLFSMTTKVDPEKEKREEQKGEEKRENLVSDIPFSL